jgi:endonuclease III
MPETARWEPVFTVLRNSVEKNILPSVSHIANDRKDPFRILISTMISLRTKDEVTLPASNRLLAKADSPAALAELSEEEIAELIYPAGFYKTKAKNIKQTALLLAENGGEVPADRDKLLELPGVGRKTANLVLNLGYGIDAICVDTHVHRISNRTGWVRTETPEQTEYALMKVLPKRYWIEINELLVSFGQKICTPVSPFCSRCGLRENYCLQTGVTRSR